MYIISKSLLFIALAVILYLTIGPTKASDNKILDHYVPIDSAVLLPDGMTKVQAAGQTYRIDLPPADGLFTALSFDALSQSWFCRFKKLEGTQMHSKIDCINSPQ